MHPRSRATPCRLAQSTSGRVREHRRGLDRSLIVAFVLLAREIRFHTKAQRYQQKAHKGFLCASDLPFVPLCETAYSNIARTTSSITSRDRRGVAARFFSITKLLRSAAFAILRNLPSFTNPSS